MALAAARRAEEQDIGAFLQPGIAGCQRHHLRFRDHWHDLEVEGGERLAGGQPRLGEMPLEAAAATVGHLVLAQYREEAGPRPTFLIGLLSRLRPPPPPSPPPPPTHPNLSATPLTQLPS